MQQLGGMRGGKSVTGKGIYFALKDYYTSPGICKWYSVAYTL